jgi:hypothetical protein
LISLTHQFIALTTYEALLYQPTNRQFPVPSNQQSNSISFYRLNCIDQVLSLTMDCLPIPFVCFQCGTGMSNIPAFDRFVSNAIRPKSLPLQSCRPHHWLRQCHCPRSTKLDLYREIPNSNQELDCLLACLPFLRLLCN